MAALMLLHLLQAAEAVRKGRECFRPVHGGAGKEEELLTIDMFCAPANYQGYRPAGSERRSRTPATWRSQHHSAQRGGGGDSLYQTRSAAGNLGDLIVIRKDQLEDCYKGRTALRHDRFLANSKNLKNYKQILGKSFKSFLGQTESMRFCKQFFSVVPHGTERLDGGESIHGDLFRWDYYKELGKAAAEKYGRSSGSAETDAGRPHG